ARAGTGPAVRWRVVVQFGTGPGAGSQPAYGAAFVGRVGALGPRASGGAGASAAVDGRGHPGIRDKLVTSRAVVRRLACRRGEYFFQSTNQVPHEQDSRSHSRTWPFPAGEGD